MNKDVRNPLSLLRALQAFVYAKDLCLFNDKAVWYFYRVSNAGRWMFHLKSTKQSAKQTSGGHGAKPTFHRAGCVTPPESLVEITHTGVSFFLSLVR